MVSKQPEVTLKTQQALEAAFLELNARKPIEKISVRAITEKAGYNRATFYLYYASVYDIRRRIEEAFFDFQSAAFARSADAAGRIRLDEGLTFLLKMARQYGSAISVFLGPYGDPAFSDELKQRMWPAVRQFSGMADGENLLSEQERELAKEFYIAGVLAVLRRWLSDADGMSIEEYAAFAVHLVSGGKVDMRAAASSLSADFSADI